MKEKQKRKSPSKRKSFPEVTASRIKPEKQEEGLHLVRKKRLSGKKNKERKKKKPYEMSPHHTESVSAVENQCSRIQFL